MIEIRIAHRNQAKAIALMSRRFIEFGLGWTWRPQRVASYIANPEAIVLVAMDSSRIAGFAIMEFFDGHAHLNLMAVHPEFQHKGVGRDLLDWLDESARVAGIDSIIVEVRVSNAGGRRFYRRAGYREIAHLGGYYARRESALRMLRDPNWNDTREPRPSEVTRRNPGTDPPL